MSIAPIPVELFYPQKSKSEDDLAYASRRGSKTFSSAFKAKLRKRSAIFPKQKILMHTLMMEEVQNMFEKSLIVTPYKGKFKIFKSKNALIHEEVNNNDNKSFSEEIQDFSEAKSSPSLSSTTVQEKKRRTLDLPPNYVYNENVSFDDNPNGKHILRIN
jgi:hypothetical protein